MGFPLAPVNGNSISTALLQSCTSRVFNDQLNFNSYLIDILVVSGVTGGDVSHFPFPWEALLRKSHEKSRLSVLLTIGSNLPLVCDRLGNIFLSDNENHVV